MFVLNGYINIVKKDGSFSYTIKAINDVRIKKSIHSYTDTASFKIPASARLKLQKADGNSVLPLLPMAISYPDIRIDTASQFAEGDSVEIVLGYDDNLVTEFKGFISRVNFTRPCEIECEGYIWPLRNVDKLLTKSWTSTSLKQVLQYIIDNTGNHDIIKLSTDIPDTTFGPFRLAQNSGAEALDNLKKTGFTVYFIDNVIYAGLEQVAQLKNSVIYSLGWNTIKDDELKYRSELDVKTQVVVNYKDKNGKAQVKTFGNKAGVLKRLNLGRELDMKVLEEKARAWSKQFRHAGYEGRITGFLQPFALPGWKVSIQDDLYKERSGSYLLVSTEVSYSRSGGRRICEIGETLTVTGTVPDTWD